MILNGIFILSLLVVINGQSNCSSGDWCGSHGYCLNTEEGNWTCECKFWWEGELCNRQSDNGKQVIILSCVVGLLISILFIFRIGRIIYKKHKDRKETKIQEPLNTPKFINVAKDHIKRSAQLKSCLIGICMIIIAGTTLVAKWSLLQKIHNEIVDQYINHTDEPLYFNRTYFCKILDSQEFNVFTFPIACLIFILCIIMTKRISFMKDKCHGYVAPPIPIDFLSHLDRKLAAIIFAIIADELLRIVQEVINGSSKTNQGVLVTYLYRIAQVLNMGFKFYPILAAVYINNIFILLCATLYTWLIYSFTIVTQGMCNPKYYPTYNDYLAGLTDINDKLKYYGTGSSLIAIQLCTDIPQYLCLAYVSVKLPAILIEKIFERRRKENLADEKFLLKSLTREEKLLIKISHSDSIEMRYVKNLFLPFNQRSHSRHTIFARLIPKFIYEWRDDFRFSSRVLCIYSSLFLLLFFVTIAACVEVIPLLQTIQNSLQDILDTIINVSINSENEMNIRSNFPVPNLVRPFLLAVSMTTTIIVVQLLILLVNIRRNLLQVYRGDDSEIPRRKRSKYILYATGNFHFAGYFIGYLVWGFIIIATFSSIVCICIDSFIVFGSVRILEKILKLILPSLLIMAFKQYLNQFLAQYIFLQDYADVLALNNRRILMIFIYFNFYLDAFLGFISSILRLGKSIIGGIFYMCRLDYSPLGRKLESFDSGFNAYCGFIHTECTHRHPIMLIFVSHLFGEIKKQQQRYKIDRIYLNDLLLLQHEKQLIQQKKSLRYIRKWKLAVFLVRNPVVVFFRKAFIRQLPIENRRALNDIDHDSGNNIHRTTAFYTRQMAAQRPSFVTEINPKQIILQTF